MKVIEKRSKPRSQAKQQKQSKPPVDAAAALRAKIEAATVPALRHTLTEELPKIVRELIYRKIGIEMDSWNRFRVVSLDPVVDTLLTTIAKETADAIAAQVDTFEVGAAEMREIRLAYERYLREAVMDRVAEIAKERAEAVAEDVVARAIVSGDDNAK